MLSLNLSVDYKTKPGVLKNACLRIETGEIVGLAGQSGSGKSTLSMAVLGLLGRGSAKVSGEVLFNGIDLLLASERELRSLRGREIALVLQSALSSLNPSMSVGKHLWEAWCAHSGESRKVWLARVMQLLNDVGLPAAEEFLKRYPRELSVGIAQRVLIAMSVLHRPGLLIADEPTSALDLITQAETLKLFQQMNQQFGTAILFISHDLLSVASLCQRVAILHEGAIVESGPTAKVFSKPLHPYTRSLMGALPGLPPIEASATSDLLNLAFGADTDTVKDAERVSREPR